MKKFIVVLINIFVFITFAQAQLTANGNYKIYNNFQGIDNLIVFNGIVASTEISYTGNANSVNWYKFSDLTNSISNLRSFSPEDNTGYILDADGKKTRFWVFDYKNYVPVFTSFIPENTPSTQCKNLKINLIATIPPMSYFTKDNTSFTIGRNFNLTYQTLEWGGESWKTKDIAVGVTLPKTTIEVADAPLCDTYFTLSGDQFADELNIKPASIISPFYSAVAVACKITTTTTERIQKNEADRPDKKTVSGSSPLDILFISNANVPVATFYKWEIKKEGKVLINRTTDEHRYTFVDAGSYTVVLTVSNNYCSYSDSVKINISTSAIQVPNVFTPNGDGVNDEFRVAYKSIKSFQCWVYNRWGRKVYYWNDPQKGWDGKINGRDAAPGAYFYVIKALGTDFVPSSAPDQVTRKRVGEYLLKGDINLLRGGKD
ncbi:MAG: gliding motility-associated C-terminal domain-containing protein [Paludibacter sp.]|nr:gliding motility-associated C-terminal domain-containing protein [Paludibacter sp.]